MTINNVVPPRISVIVPVRNDPRNLRECLEGLRQSTYDGFEIIVVDDASTDDTPVVAEALATRVVRLAAQSGPALARNRGAEAVQGEIVVFIDADIVVKPDTLTLFAEIFDRQPDLAASFGAYDKEPRCPNVISQYRNLMHHFVHQEGASEASTFWSGCGAIRRKVFLSFGGFDVAYRRPCIEDIELGTRLRRAGHRILLASHVQVTHLKRWTLWGMLKADVRDRALPWTELILREGALPNDLNLKHSQRLCALLALGLVVCLLLGSLSIPALLLLPVGLAVITCVVDAWSLRYRVPTTFRILTCLSALAALVAIGWHFQLWALVPLALFLGICFINRHFYGFLARQKQPLFALFVLPLHVLYFLYSSGAFALGVCLYGTRKLLAQRRPSSQPELGKP